MRKRRCSNLGLWSAVEPHLAMTDNVRAALAFVARGEAPLGIVYATDAVADPTVKVVATFPEPSHAPITYPFALTASSHNDGGGQASDLSEVLGGAHDLRASGLQGSELTSQGDYP